MQEEVVKSPIKVNTDEREADLDTRIKRARALGAVIVRFFEQREYSEEAVCEVKYVVTTFTNNKVMEALLYADELLRSKGYVPIMALEVSEREVGKRESEKSAPDRICTVRIAVRPVEETKEFKDAVKRAVSQVA